MEEGFTAAARPVPNVSQAVVANQLIAVVKRTTSKAVASLPRASLVHSTAEARVQGTLVKIRSPTRRSACGISKLAIRPRAGTSA